MLRFTKLLVLGFYCVSANVHAQTAPVVSDLQFDGQFVQGSPVTITGAGFGTVPLSDFMKWDTVENQAQYERLASGEPVPVGPGLPWGSGDLSFDTSIDQRHAYSGAQYSSPGGNHFVGNPQRDDGGSFDYSGRQNLFISWWIKFDRNPFEVNNSAAHKLIRVWGGDSDDLRISWNSRNMVGVSNRNAGGGSSINAYSLVPGETLWPENQWHLMEMWVSAEKGLIRCYVNGTLALEWENDSSEYLKTQHPSGPRVALVGFNPSHGEGFVGNAQYKMDDIAVASTQARVLLSHASSFSNSKYHEYQPIQSWEDGRIEFRTNLGALDQNADLFLYIITQDGVVNEQGYPVAPCPACPERIQLNLQ